MLRATILVAVAAVMTSCLPNGGADRAGDGQVRARLARVALCDALAEWSTQTGRAHCYAAALPEREVVVAGPGDELALEPVLAGAGWEMVAVGDVTLVARRGDEAEAVKLGKALRGSKDEAERRAAAYALGRLAVPAAVAPLVAGLADESEAVRFQCLEALWALEGDFDVRRLPGRVSLFRVAKFDPAPLVTLAASASGDRARRAWRCPVVLLGRAGSGVVRQLAREGLVDLEPRVRLVSAEALAETATAEDEPALAAFARSTRDWAARGAALRALARLPGPGRELNLSELAVGQDDDLARQACEALGFSGRDEAVTPLARAFMAGSPERAALAAEALGRLGRPEADEVLLAGLGAPEPWRRAAAAAGLSARGRRADPALAGSFAAAASGSPEAAAAVARALPEAAGAAALEPLVKLSRETDARVRLAATRALRRLGGPKALARLHELAADADREVRVEAQTGLGWLGDVAEAKKLAAIASVPSTDRDAAEGALVGLGHLRSPAARDVAVATLLELMKDPPACPHAAGRAAIALADARLLPGLLEVMARSQMVKKGAPRSGVRLSVDCMDALGRIATRESAEALAKDWWEWENMTRYEVGRALRENLDRGENFATLLRLTESSGHTLTAAGFSLANSRDPRAVAALVKMLSERREPLAAAAALGMIADPAATDALLAAARDATHPGRFAAARALRMRDLAWQPRVREALAVLYGWRADGTPLPVEEQPAGTWMLRRWARDYDDHSMSSLTYESAAT
ncbi:MAG TPA: HEAT repeat domain-containing protein, partial [Planctomycetota bacterium]|nr:HEAT repeat domain-containing protein [Planctomycetota bacterium]